MIRGTFEEPEGRPYVQGRFYVPSLKIMSTVDFLVDTGADTTMLGLRDGQLLDIDYAALQLPVKDMLGVGRTASTASVKAALGVFDTFSQSIYVRMYRIQLDLLMPPRDEDEDEGKHENALSVPSILGRDILWRWRIDCDFPRGQLRFLVRSSDRRVKL